MKKINLSLIVGLIIVLGIIFLIFFGEYFAPYDASVGEQSVWVHNQDGTRELKRSPFGPDGNHIFGTDDGGRDVLSVIMAGAKNTFFIVFLAMLLRFIIAIPIAFFSAFGEKISKWIITIFSSTFSAVPSLLICIMILKVDVIKELDLRNSMLAFIILFTIVGWGRLASTIEGKIKDILKQDFIQGEIAIGKSKFSIAIKNVTAHIMPWIVIYIFLEIALVLLLLAQLGVFEVFVGNKQVYTIKTLGQMSRSNFNYFPEWGAMLASTKRSIVGNRFWLSLFPLIAFSLSIVGFNLLGQGLNHELNKRNSMFISNVNKLIFHLSPITFIDEIKNYKKKWKIVISKTLIIIMVVLIVAIPTMNALSIVDNTVMAHILETNKDEYDGRLIGTPGHDRYAEYIVNRLKEYNIEPLFDGDYINEFDIDATINIINDSELKITDGTGQLINELKYKIDYYFETWSSNYIKDLEGEILTSDKFLNNEFDPNKDYIIVLNYKDSQLFIYDKIASQLDDYKCIKAVIIPDLKRGTINSKVIDLEQKGLTRILDNIESLGNEIPPVRIKVGKRAGTRLWNLGGNKINISNEIDNPNGFVGKNIGGIIRGKSTESPIIVATSYDYLGFHDGGTEVDIENIVKFKGLYENGTSIAGSLEMARNLGKIKQIPDRSMIFLFIDGFKVTIEGVRDIGNQDIFEGEPLMIYMNYMGINKMNRSDDSLYHSTLLNKNGSKAEQEFHIWLRRHSANSDYYIIGDNLIRERSLLALEDKDMVGIVLQGIKERDKNWHLGMAQSDLEEIDMKRLTTHIQFLLDSITDIAYGKVWLK